MNDLSLSEQGTIVAGGVGSFTTPIGAGIGAAAFGDSSVGCAVLGSAVGTGVTIAMGMTGMGGIVGGFTSSAVTNACNNRPGYPAGSRSESGMPSNANRYWPSAEHWRGGGGGGINNWLVEALSQL